MQLKAYLDREGLSMDEFSKSLGVHRTTLYRIINGLSYPRKKVTLRILELTKGKVTAKDFLEQVPRSGASEPPVAAAE
jgi:predicted transcriptional regulator